MNQVYWVNLCLALFCQLHVPYLHNLLCVTLYSNIICKVFAFQCSSEGPVYSSLSSLINRSIPSKNMNGDQMCTRTVARNQSEVNISCHTVHLNLSYLLWFWWSLIVFHIFLIFFQSVIRNTIRRLLKVNKIYI